MLRWALVCVDIINISFKKSKLLFWFREKIDKVHSISHSLLEKAKIYGLDRSIKQKVIFPAVNTNKLKQKTKFV